jgi:hypothetical protein
MAMMIDTFEFVTDLEKAGIKEDAAKAIVKKFVEMQTNFVSKEEFREEKSIAIRDLKVTENDLVSRIEAVDRKIDNVEARLKQEIEISRKDIIIKLGAMMIGGFAVAIAVLGFLISHN